MKKLSIIVALSVVLGSIAMTGCSSLKKETAVSDVIDVTDMADGTYTVEATLEGGTGRASVMSPVTIEVKERKVTARVEWSSEFYDQMVVEGVTYLPVNATGNSVFEVPVNDLTQEMIFQAETIAMSTPHMIEYKIIFDTSTLKTVLQPIAGMQPDYSMELQYAQNFQVDYYEGDLAFITIADGSRFLVIPEGADVPAGVAEDVVILQKPVTNIYLAATASMGLFDVLDGLDAISLSGTQAEGWYIPHAREAMEAGNIKYAGKYSEPDYELLASSACELAIESTMINHTPEVKEQLEQVGIPVLTDYASYEEHPLGRTEWMKLYAVLLGKEELADELFEQQVMYLNQAMETNQESEKEECRSVAFFYISSNGYAVTRKSGDYIPKMISLAGGKYIFDSLSEDDESAMSTVKLEMEQFYATAKDADFIIYNGTIDGGVTSMEELIAMNSLLADFKAVKNGNVWCTNNNFYQETTGLGEATKEIHDILTGKAENMSGNEMKFFSRIAG